ncbi:MAG: transglycosylase SLT domain-containing protein [Pseudonocardiaceae bacterium]|nr:transglycosylase SLT domain-containing protein [Pseudonocardiaceae bacterium]
MGSADTLAGYAGGEAVASAAAKVKDADQETITAAATRLSKAASAASTYGGAVAGGVTSLDEAWEGASADAFVGYMNKFRTAGVDIGTALTNAATALTNVATALAGAKTYVSTRCDQALTDITSWVDAHPQATQEQFDAMTRDRCSAVATDIDTHLQSTESTLASALTTINASKSPATRFSTLPQPSTQPFTPRSGQPVEWLETPPPETRPEPESRSAPAGTDQPAQQTSNSGGMGSSGGPPAGGPPPGNVQEWINQAIEILRQNGVNVGPEDAQRIWQIIQHESGGNPHAINNWDSNAAKGTPSKGLMQCIDPTFDSYQVAGHGDIWNPVDNICAGVNYAISRYGSLANVPGIKATAGGGSYVGY